MKNKEKYANFINMAFANVYDDVCEFKKEHILKVKSCTFVDCHACNKATLDWLEQEYQEPPILDDKEREYLSAVIRPWRDKVKSIAKYRYSEEVEYICIEIRCKYIDLPPFKAGTMYKGMELCREYSIEDLGL